jgi:predicted DNA-binding transcriptional regulator AlpA
MATTTKPQTLLGMDDLVELFGVRRQTIYRWMRAGLFPKPRRFGRRCIRWRAADVEEFISQGAQRDETVDA